MKFTNYWLSITVLTHKFVLNTGLQERVVHARIECLHPVGFQSYVAGDEVVAPVTQIDSVVPVTATILRKALIHQLLVP